MLSAAVQKNAPPSRVSSCFPPATDGGILAAPLRSHGSRTDHTWATRSRKGCRTSQVFDVREVANHGGLELSRSPVQLVLVELENLQIMSILQRLPGRMRLCERLSILRLGMDFKPGIWVNWLCCRLSSVRHSILHGHSLYDGFHCSPRIRTRWC